MKTPEILHAASRQYNLGCSVRGFDYEETIKVVTAMTQEVEG